MFLITIAFVALIGALIFSAVARSQVGTFMGRVANIAGGIAYNALTLLRGITRGVIGFLIAFLVLYAVVVVAIGISTGQFWLSFWIGIILFPLWCFLFIVSRAGILRIPYWAISILLIASLFRFGIGLWSELVDNSLHLRVETLKEYFANRMDTSSMKSEPYGKVFAVVDAEDGKATVYNDAREASGTLNNGTRVMVISAFGKRVDVDSEPMARIMLANGKGDFIGGQIAWISIRRIDFSEGRERKDAKPSQTPSSSPQTSKHPCEVCWDSYCEEGYLKLTTDEKGDISLLIETERSLFVGSPKLSSYEYVGTWSKNDTSISREPFQIIFNPSLAEATGWAMEEGGKKDIKITKK